MVEKFRKRLCMSELIVYYSHHQSQHFCDISSGKVDSSIAFIESGSVTMSIGGKKVTLGKNSLYYMPDGIRYTSLWHGEPDICYFDLHVVSNRPDKTNAQRYAMTHIKELSTQETGKRVQKRRTHGQGARGRTVLSSLCGHHSVSLSGASGAQKARSRRGYSVHRAEPRGGLQRGRYGGALPRERVETVSPVPRRARDNAGQVPQRDEGGESRRRAASNRPHNR